MDKSRIAKILVALFMVVMLFGGCESKKTYYSVQNEMDLELNPRSNMESEATEETPPEEFSEYNYTNANHNNFSPRGFAEKYVNAIGAAIKNGDFSMVQPYLKRDSSLYTVLERRVEKLYSEGTKEYVIVWNVRDMEWNTKKSGVMVLYEKIDTVDSSGESTITEVTYEYIIEFVDGRYVLSGRTKTEV